MPDSKNVQDFYDRFAAYEVKTGINLRHYRIFNEIIRAGLKPNHQVLEIGCGIGQITGLLHSYLKKGKMVSTDISPESIAIARKRIGPSSRLEFFVTDMTDFDYKGVFDFIILPDVLEHIPKENHRELFGLLSSVMHDRSILLIHIPHPQAIEFVRAHNPEVLQIIDQALEADELLANAYHHPLKLLKYDAYTLFQQQPDYVFITFTKNHSLDYLPYRKWKIILKKQWERIVYLFNNLV